MVDDRTWQINVELALSVEKAELLLGVVEVGADGRPWLAKEFEPLTWALGEAVRRFKKTGDPRQSRTLVAIGDGVANPETVGFAVPLPGEEHA